MSNSTSSTFTFSRPVSPTKEKDGLKPNPHPYAIKTTSTALLSRSNSSPQPQGPAPRHYYVPTSPSPNNASLSRNSPSPTRSLNGHRYSKSLTSDNPRPLPIPPSFSTSPSRSSNPFETPPRTRTKRADTLPSIPTSAAEELPENPKQWTPSQLSTYLTTALRIKSGESLDLPIPVARDIAAFVRESRITGKSFLRLNEEDLEGYGVNKLWRTALLAASRNLRQSVLRGRIWGLGSGLGSQDEDDDDVDDHDDGTPNNNRRRDPMYASESSSTESFHSASSSSSSVGRVRGMVANFERSVSTDDLTAQISRSRSGSSSGILEDGGFYEPYSTKVLPQLDNEPSMESLLASRPDDGRDEAMKLGGSGRKTRKGGVYNWETEKGLGITIKHVGGERRGVGEIFGADDVDEGREGEVDANEKRVEAELKETRSLIDAFRVRLEEVEKKVGEMEDKERKRAREHEEAEERRRQEAEKEEAARKLEAEALTHITEQEQGRRRWNNGLVGLLLSSKPGSAIMGALEYVSGFARIEPSTGEAQRKRDSKVKRAASDSDPKTVSALPSYVLLVSLGVCVVVLRVMLRRAIGSGRRR